MMNFTKGTFKVIRDDGSTLATVKIEGATVLTRWDGDSDFAEDDDGMELLVLGEHTIEEIS